MEIIEWVAQLSQNAMVTVTATSLNSFIVFCYIVLSVKIKDGRFLAAFLICEVWANTIWDKSMGEVAFFAGYTLIYLHLYWFIRQYKFKTILFCITMVLFEMGMMIDARVNSGIQSVLYTYYVHIVISIHFCIICSFIKWGGIWGIIVEFVNSLLGIRSHSYSVPFFMLQFVKQVRKKQPKR